MHTALHKFYREGIEVIDCLECGYKHLQPIPTEKELKEFYEREYFVTTQADYYEQQLRDNQYLSVGFETKLAKIKNHLSKELPLHILDIGCGSGLFLKFFKEHGWACTGIEPSLTGVSNLAKQHGICIYEASFDDVCDEVGRFSVVTLNEVLEHVSDPLALCKKIYEKNLVSGGILQVTVPNEFNPLQMLACQELQMNPYWIVKPDHINYFDVNSIQTLLGKAGFKKLEVDTTFPLEMFILMGQNYVGDSVVGKEIHQQRVLFETRLHKTEAGRALLKAFYQQNAQIGIGREVIAYFIKE